MEGQRGSVLGTSQCSMYPLASFSQKLALLIPCFILALPSDSYSCVSTLILARADTQQSSMISQHFTLFRLLLILGTI